MCCWDTPYNVVSYSINRDRDGWTDQSLLTIYAKFGIGQIYMNGNDSKAEVSQTAEICTFEGAF